MMLHGPGFQTRSLVCFALFFIVPAPLGLQMKNGYIIGVLLFQEGARDQQSYRSGWILGPVFTKGH